MLTAGVRLLSEVTGHRKFNLALSVMAARGNKTHTSLLSSV